MSGKSPGSGQPRSGAGQSHFGSPTSQLPSFPRKRESRGERRVLGRWIPASAGMTEERKAAVSPNAIALPSGRRGRRDGMANGASRVAPGAGKSCLVDFRVSSAAYPPKAAEDRVLDITIATQTRVQNHV